MIFLFVINNPIYVLDDNNSAKFFDNIFIFLIKKN